MQLSDWFRIKSEFQEFYASIHIQEYEDGNKMIRPVTILSQVIVLCNVVHANSAGVKGDIEYGQYLAAECVTCHSTAGLDKGIPAIIGWEEANFISVINAYKSKELENPVMQVIAVRLDDEQIASLALYFASLPEEK